MYYSKLISPPKSFINYFGERTLEFSLWDQNHQTTYIDLGTKYTKIKVCLGVDAERQSKAAYQYGTEP